MINTSNNQNVGDVNKVTIEEIPPSFPAPENNAYLKLRRTALISTVILIILILASLLYLNGQSLYENGL